LKFLILISLIILSSCRDKEVSQLDEPSIVSDSSIDETSSSPDQEDESSNDDNESEDSSNASNQSEGNENSEVSEEEDNTTIAIFKFNKNTGKCVNADNEFGFNNNIFTECGDLSESMVEQLDFRSKGYFGLNLSNTEILDSKIHYRRLADYETIYDRFTLFDNKKNPFTNLFDQHSFLINREFNKIEKVQNKISKIKNKIASLRSKYEQITKEKKKERILKQIVKLQERLEKFTDFANLSMNKMIRHRDFAKNTYVIAQDEPSYTKTNVKNKKWLSLDGRAAKNTHSASDLFGSHDQFTISIWFRTLYNQGEKRLFNFNHENSQSAFLIAVKNGRVFIGFRNEAKKYSTLEYKYMYYDNNWNNVVGTYDGSVFKFFFNGEMILEKESGFSGFGDKLTNFGSYQSRSHFFKGELDEASIWSKALDDENIKKIYNNGIPSKLNRHPNADLLLKWWRMGDKVKKSIRGKFVD